MAVAVLVRNLRIDAKRRSTSNIGDIGDIVLLGMMCFLNDYVCAPFSMCIFYVVVPHLLHCMNFHRDQLTVVSRLSDLLLPCHAPPRTVIQIYVKLCEFVLQLSVLYRTHRFGGVAVRCGC